MSNIADTQALSADMPILPPPVLDPDALQTACLAFDRASLVLRERARSSLSPAVRHRLAARIIRLATTGERDEASLADRALLHFSALHFAAGK